MKNSTKLTLKILCCAVFALTAVGAILYYAALRTSFDTSIMHFSSTPVFIGMLAVFILAPVLSLAAGISLRKRASVTAPPAVTPFTSFAACFLGCLLLADSILNIVRYRAQLVNRSNILLLLATVAGILAFLYFAVIRGGERTHALRMWLSLAPVVWAGCVLLMNYFDLTRAFNDPVKSLELTVCAAFMLFFCEDIRFRLNCQSPPIFYFITLSSVFVSFAVGIPHLILSVTDTPTFSFSVMDSSIYIALGLYALSRLLAMPKVLGEYVEPEKK